MKKVLIIFMSFSMTHTALAHNTLDTDLSSERESNNYELTPDDKKTLDEKLIQAAHDQSRYRMWYALEHGANINAAEKNSGRTALMILTSKNNYKLVKFLCDQVPGPDYSATDSLGDTALDIAKKTVFGQDCENCISRAIEKESRNKKNPGKK